MRYLLDVNALVAALWAAHVHHARVHEWLRSRGKSDVVLSCGLTEAGFIRVINAAYAIPVADAKAAVRAFCREAAVEFIAQTPPPRDALPAWVRGHQQVMDGYLIAIAESAGAQLATLDRGIPGAKLIP